MIRSIPLYTTLINVHTENEQLNLDFEIDKYIADMNDFFGIPIATVFNSDTVDEPFDEYFPCGHSQCDKTWCYVKYSGEHIFSKKAY